MSNILDLLPYLGAGSTASIPFIFWRVAQLEATVKTQKESIITERKRANLIYFYLAKKDTNFGDFLNKHDRNI